MREEAERWGRQKAAFAVAPSPLVAEASVLWTSPEPLAQKSWSAGRAREETDGMRWVWWGNALSRWERVLGPGGGRVSTVLPCGGGPGADGRARELVRYSSRDTGAAVVARAGRAMRCAGRPAGTSPANASVHSVVTEAHTGHSGVRHRRRARIFLLRRRRRRQAWTRTRTIPFTCQPSNSNVR